MMRGTFANIRIKNEMLGGKEGGNTLYYTGNGAAGQEMSIYDAAMKYEAAGTPRLSSPARNTAPVPHATGRLRALACSAFAR
jgi:hypothetical protein